MVDFVTAQLGETRFSSKSGRIPQLPRLHERYRFAIFRKSQVTATTF
jgi:hypothetical protein